MVSGGFSIPPPIVAFWVKKSPAVTGELARVPRNAGLHRQAVISRPRKVSL
jgi:hypothetical protein